MIKDNLWKDIKAYADANGIEDVDKLVNSMLTRGFTIEKFGETPSTTQEVPEVIEKEVIKEVIKEVPFEVVKEVEVIKEVEKIVNVTDDAELNNLLTKISDMEKDHEDTITAFKEGRKIQTQTIMKLNKEKDLIKEEYEAKLKEKDEEITKLKSKKDFYGE